MDSGLTQYRGISSIVGDIVNLRVPDAATMSTPPRNRDLAIIEQDGAPFSLAQIISLTDDSVSLQVFAGTKGLGNDASVRFLGETMQAIYSDNIFGRIFNGSAEPIDGGPALQGTHSRAVDIIAASLR